MALVLLLRRRDSQWYRMMKGVVIEISSWRAYYRLQPVVHEQGYMHVIITQPPCGFRLGTTTIYCFLWWYNGKYILLAALCRHFRSVIILRWKKLFNSLKSYTILIFCLTASPVYASTKILTGWIVAKSSTIVIKKGTQLINMLIPVLSRVALIPGHPLKSVAKLGLSREDSAKSGKKPRLNCLFILILIEKAHAFSYLCLRLHVIWWR